MEQSTGRPPFGFSNVKDFLIFDFNERTSEDNTDSKVDMKGNHVKVPFTIVGYDFPIFFREDRQEFIDSIDLIIEYEKHLYFLKVEMGIKGFDTFWEASKVIAYTKIHNYFSNKQYQPAILLRYDQITENIQKVATILKVELFGVYWDENENELIIKNVTKRRQ